MNRKECLDAAAEAVLKNRQATYGPTEKLHAQRTRSGDEWEVVNAKNVVQSNGFDSEADAEGWIENQKKRKAK